MRKLLLLLGAVLCVSIQLLAQQRTVTGKVTDANGNAVPNASVIVKGTTVGTTTKPDGTYSLTIPNNARALLITSIGMSDMEITIGNKGIINAELTSSDKNLQEVVVVGYGTQKKKEVTASIGKIDPSPISTLVSPSIDKQLGGRTPGLQITNPSGLVNQPPRIRVRGVNSVSGARDPLIVLDGAPIATGGFSGVTNDNLLADINPNDIASIEVLKDGSATAIYGSRAANGVILITTKKGRQGTSRVNYSNTFGYASPSKKFDLLNATDFVAIANEKLNNGGVASAAFLNAANTNTDWQSIVLRDRAFSQTHNLSVEGGNDKTTYFLSFNYANQQGLVVTNGVKRYAVRANLEHKVNKWIKLSNNITLSRTEDNDQNNGGNSLSGAIYNAIRALPNVRAYDPANTKFDGYNITADGAALGVDSNKRVIDNNNSNIAFVLAHNKFKSTKHRIIDNMGIEIKPLSWLTYTGKINLDYATSTDFQSLDSRHGDGKSSGGVILNQNINNLIWVLSNYINASKTFGKHSIGLTVGSELQDQRSNSYFAQGTSVSDLFFLQQNVISNSYATQLSGGGYAEGPGIVSYFGRLNYDFAGKFFIQGSMRRDGLSRFASDNRYGNFPGASVGYRISNEDFWTHSIGRVVNEFKIRASWAKVGNDRIPGGNNPYLSTYGSAPYGSVSGISIAQVGNSSLTWETNEKVDLGIDFSLFNSRINVVLDYFQNKNNNLVLAAPLPPSFGIPGNNITKNIGTMENKGIELAINATIVKSKDFTWDFGVNYTNQTNKVLSLYQHQDVITGLSTGNYGLLREGQPINALYGYSWAGVNSGNGNPVYYKADGSLLQGNIANSSYFVANSLSDGTLGAAGSLATTDRRILGNPLPKFYGGINSDFRYKNFGLSMLWRFSGGNKIMNITAQESLYNQGFTNSGTVLLDRWRKPGDITNVPKLWYGRDNFINLTQSANSRFVENGDFTRLDNLQISYGIPAALLNRVSNGNIKSFRFYVQGQNLVLITKYKGIDPDNITEAGLDYNTAPPARTISFGLNLGF